MTASMGNKMVLEFHIGQGIHGIGRNTAKCSQMNAPTVIHTAQALRSHLIDPTDTQKRTPNLGIEGDNLLFLKCFGFLILMANFSFFFVANISIDKKFFKLKYLLFSLNFKFFAIFDKI